MKFLLFVLHSFWLASSSWRLYNFDLHHELFIEIRVCSPASSLQTAIGVCFHRFETGPVNAKASERGRAALRNYKFDKSKLNF